MKRILKDKRAYSIVAGISVVIIIVGFVMISRVFDKYDLLVKENVDGQLLRLTRSVDRSVESYLGRYVDNLIHITDHENALEVETEEFEAILLVQGEKVLASSTEGVNYFFPEQEKSSREINLRPCLDDQGVIYLEVDMGVTFAEKTFSLQRDYGYAMGSD